MSEPSRIAEQELLHLVDNGNRLERPTPGPPDEQFYRLAVDKPNSFEEIKRLGTDELIARLTDRPGDFGDTQITQLVKEMWRVEIALRGSEPENRREQAGRKLEIVRRDGLPPERQAALLAQAYVQTGDQAHRDALIDLVGVEKAEALISEAGGS